MAVHELFVYLRAKSAERAVKFYKDVFGATEKFRLAEPSGRIGHVELALGEHPLGAAVQRGRGQLDGGGAGTPGGMMESPEATTRRPSTS